MFWYKEASFLAARAILGGKRTYRVAAHRCWRLIAYAAPINEKLPWTFYKYVSYLIGGCPM